MAGQGLSLSAEEIVVRLSAPVEDRPPLASVMLGELTEQVCDVSLDGGLAEEQLRGDLDVRAAPGHELEYRELAVGQGLHGEYPRCPRSVAPHVLLHEALSDRRGEQSLAACHDAHGVGQLLWSHVLEQEAAGAGA